MDIRPFNENALPIVARCIETYGGYVAGKTYPVVKLGKEVYVVRLDENGDERSMLCFEATIKDGNVGLYPAIGDGPIPDVVFEAETLSLNTLRDVIYQDAVAHGLWEDVEKDACELSEEEPHLRTKDGEVEYYRRYYASKLVFLEGDELLLAAEDDDLESLKEELADVVIQAFSTAGYLGIDIDAAIRRKMEINRNRPWKHEGEKK